MPDSLRDWAPIGDTDSSGKTRAFVLALSREDLDGEPGLVGRPGCPGRISPDAANALARVSDQQAAFKILCEYFYCLLASRRAREGTGGVHKVHMWQSALAKPHRFSHRVQEAEREIRRLTR
ncbi:hypothetical protein Thi970DRAFT_00361 [Thiorhodovibrio frisius]|uniref:Uncharacterized protein n=1 Tax=Thiorhodovibrio frisius TaxID=631362 RepID=H8YW55_9GAMM|nr:hypothetical protein Thi970DRAFT_00361 [Thiorhodovibrio frisius]